MKLEDYKAGLEKEIGAIISASEEMPGVYYVETDFSKRVTHEYYAVMDAAPIAAKVQNYGEKVDGLRLFAWGDPSSGSRIVHYEVSKYRIASMTYGLTEWEFRDMSLHAAELHPEYFGKFPVPFHTPWGYTLLHRTLSNGIYWLETSECKELLSICPPIWESELSFTAMISGKLMGKESPIVKMDTTEYLFFSRESSCVPIYELMLTRQEWDGTVIRRPALMNALWEYAPEYAMQQSGGKRMAGMFPGEGTDFLLLK